MCIRHGGCRSPSSSNVVVIVQRRRRRRGAPWLGYTRATGLRIHVAFDFIAGVDGNNDTPMARLFTKVDLEARMRHLSPQKSDIRAHDHPRCPQISTRWGRERDQSPQNVDNRAVDEPKSVMVLQRRRSAPADAPAKPCEPLLNTASRPEIQLGPPPRGPAKMEAERTQRARNVGKRRSRSGFLRASIRPKLRSSS